MPRGLELLLPAAALALAACAAAPREAQPATGPTHGILVGEVTDRSARVWARGERAGWMNVELIDTSDGRTLSAVSTRVGADTDFAASVQLDGLSPGTAYAARVGFTQSRAASLALDPAAPRARFSTAPAPSDARAVRFAWSGDLGGQNVGRDAQRGFAILPRILEREPEFFIALGDMIYADGVLAATGQFG